MSLTLIESTARELMDLNGLEGWTFKWNRKINVFGCVTYSTKTLEISKLLAQTEPESETLDTILHEIAHAIAGPGKEHNHEWKAIAADLGARPEAVAHAKGPSVRTLAPWVGTCPAGHVSAHRYFRKPKLRYSCSQCSTRWSEDNLLEYVKTGA